MPAPARKLSGGCERRQIAAAKEPGAGRSWTNASESRTLGVNRYLHLTPHAMASDAPAAPAPIELPARIPVLPVRSTVVFPMGATALQVAWGPNVEALTMFPQDDLLVAIVTTSEEDTPVEPERLQKIGSAVRVLDRLNLPGGVIQTTIQGLQRIQLQDVRYEDGYYMATPVPAPDLPAPDLEAERLMELIMTTLGGLAAKVERIPDEVPRILRNNVADPGRFADLAATLCHFNVASRDQVLQILDVTERLDFLLGLLQEGFNRVRAIEEEEEQRQAATGTATPRRNRPAEIRNHIRSLQAELGEIDPLERETLEMQRRIERSALPARIAAAARREAEKLRTTPSASNEGTGLRNYLEVLLDLPWDTPAPSKAEFDLAAVAAAMDRKLLGLDEVKQRMLSVLSVAKLRGDLSGPIPCIVGPPGVGKRSLAKAIAEGLGRPLVEIELGGRGETELLGARRSGSGVKAGKLLAAIRDAGVANPLFLLAEVDEIGLGSVEGDPIEGLEEFLNPEQRDAFVDRYLDLPFDLSGVLFIGSATDFRRIPRVLRDQFIEIGIAGSTPEEKAEIAFERLLPRLIEEHGLEPEDVEVDEEMLLDLTRGYARDAGIGSLRRVLSALLRFFAFNKTSGVAGPQSITPDLMEEVLGSPRYQSTTAENAPEVGVVTGLAWTASGGELMFIEALKMAGTGRLIITGMLGDVMRESVNAAYSYVRSRAELLGISEGAFGDHDVHIHFPVGATPKEGPSAGAAVTLAIASSLAERPVRHDVAMTGEVTLRGKVLEIGGTKEKILAAYRAGLREVVLPAGNERDLRDVPADVRTAMQFHFVDRMEQIFDIALMPQPKKKRASNSRRQSSKSRSRAAPKGAP